MTVIAVRDGVMAADSLDTDGQGVRVNTGVKIRRIRGRVVGASGTAQDCEAFFHWYANGGLIGDDSEPELEESFSGVILDKSGVYRVENNLHPFLITNAFHADGSGGDLARGAMEMGATAKEAVAVAIKHHASCGEPVVVEEL